MRSFRVGVHAASFLATVLLMADGAVRGGSTWPTLHNDYQRSGSTAEVVRGPYQRKWWRDFHDEMIATRCEAIVAENKVFVGTFAGRLHALDVETGETAWTFRARGPIGASPCYHDGKLYVGSDDAFNRGTLYCIRASDGKAIWTYASPGGIWTSPACDGRRIYCGDRTGLLHAVESADGSAAWTFATGAMILKPVSFSPDGARLVFGAEDMHVYCLGPDGRRLWKSRKLHGVSLRDQGATIWQGLAIVRTNPADAFHTVLGRNGELLKQIQLAIPREPDDEVLLDRWNDLLMKPSAKRRAAEMAGVVDYLKTHPYDQTFYAFDLQDGSQPWVAPILYTAGLHNPATPPTFHPHTGQLFTIYRTALTYYVRGVRRYVAVARLDRRTGRVDWSWPSQTERNWRQFPLIPDETQALSMMGDLLVSTHQGDLAAMDPASGSVTPISPTRDTYAGIFGPGAVRGSFEGAKKLAQQGYLTGMPNEWHGPDRAIVSIADGRIFWIAGSQVVCIAGPDKKATPSGGTRPPEPFPTKLPRVVWGGNVANSGAASTGEPVGRREITADQLRAYLTLRPHVPPAAGTPLAAALRERLDAEVLELTEGANGRGWAPFVVQLGISGEERHFWRTAPTIQIVSRALPHLSQPVRAGARAFLKRLVASGCPIDRPTHASDGARREPFLLGPEMQRFAEREPRYAASIEDVDALWAYAHYADDWPTVLSRVESIARVYDQFVRNPPAFDPSDMSHDAAEHLNARIAGVLAAARLFDAAGDAKRRESALQRLATLVTQRVHHERSDHRLVRPTRVASKGLHQAKVPRYVELTPELADMLNRFSGESLSAHVGALQKALPIWYHAYGERMIGGENYISPPHLSRGLFMAWADGVGASPQQLAAKIDQPWCRADLYYIEKLTAALRQSDALERSSL